MMLYKNIKVKVRSLNGDTDYFDIVRGVLQGDALFKYLFIICQEYVHRTSRDLMKEFGFTLAKNKRYSAQTITDADYADDIALLTNSPAQAKSLLQSPERAAGSIDLQVKADKTEYVCFNQRGEISKTGKQVHLLW